MKRRNFLSMIGAATAAPLIPTMGAASAPLYSRTAFSRAVMHARLRPHVSARGIAYRLKVSSAQAEGMISEMMTKGMVRPIPGGGGVHARALSNIVKPQVFGPGAAARDAKMRQAASNRAKMVSRDAALSDMPSPMMAHLHKMCREYGMKLSPRVLYPQAAFA